MIDRFELLHRVGEGGMGTVYRARDRETDAIVAVKLLRNLRHTLGGGDDAGTAALADLARFRKEATLLSQLSHPAIVRYLDHGISRSGQPYLAMEWIDGVTLRALLGRPLGVDDTITVLRRAATALGAAHAIGVVHRDVKPSNLLLPGGRFGEATLIDFGVARRADDAHGLTRTGTIVGTPGYFSPEQVRADRVIDARADVFGLGCLAYECLTGRTPFGGEHVMAVRLRVLMSEPTPLATAAPHVPAPLAALIAAMLTKQPDCRPADGAAVAAALEQLGTFEAPATIVDAPSTELSGAFMILGSPDAPTAELAAPRELVGALAAAHGGTAAMMSDGAFVVTMPVGPGAGNRAATCALAIRSELPEVTIRVALLPTDDVLTEVDHQVGALIASAMKGVFEDTGAGRPIVLDPPAADALAGEFDITAAGKHRVLVARRDAGSAG